LDPAVTECFNCRLEPQDLPPRQALLRTEHWRVAHAFDSALPGWLVIVPRSHVLALHELPAAAHGELGDLLGRLSTALQHVVGCTKTYVMQFSEAEGFEHLHVHLVPRMPDQPADRTGPQVFGYLGAGAAARVPEDEQDRLARLIAAAVA
jgi:diadenosine tetraphosphate (Ap4A) HIT family hydrolase